MAEKKIIAVVGATGAQGRGLVEAILEEGEYQARALTRDPSSESAKRLAAAGAEVVAADIDDVESLKRAFDGAYGAFCVTFFWDHFSPEREVEQAKKMARAAKEAGVQHVVWSTLEDTRRLIPLEDDRMPTLMERYKVPHFDGKGEADQVFTSQVPTTLLLTSFYWDNIIHFGMAPTRGENGQAVFNLPMGEKALAGIAAEDIGRCAYGVFKRPELIGKTVGISGGHLTGHEMAAGLSKVLGEPVAYNAVPFDVFRSLGFPGADDLGNMFQFKHDFNESFLGIRDLNMSRTLNPRLKSFDDWAQTYKDQIKVSEPASA